MQHVVGIAKNQRLQAKAADLKARAREAYELTRQKQLFFQTCLYGARTWDRERHVVIKAEHSRMGENPRFVVTNLEGDAQDLYDRVYCARRDGKPDQRADATVC